MSASASAQPPHDIESFPPDNSNRSLSFITGVVRDAPPVFKNFGDVKDGVKAIYNRGAIVQATFVGANPRNNLRLERTYAAVEKLIIGPKGKVWTVIRDDRDWSLIFRWRRTSEVLATSEVEITWETDINDDKGVYRLRYFGDAKSLGGTVTPFEGTTSSFMLI